MAIDKLPWICVFPNLESCTDCNLMYNSCNSAQTSLLSTHFVLRIAFLRTVHHQVLSLSVGSVTICMPFWLPQEKYNKKPWILEDETGQYQYQGQMEGSQSATATYYLLMRHGKEFNAYPAGSW